MLIPSYLLLIADAASNSLDSLSTVEQYSQIIFSILTKLFIILLAVVAIVLVIRVLMESGYSIRNINVPESFTAAGFSGPVIANRIYFRLQQIIERVNATEHVKGYSTSATETDVSVDLAGMGMPIKGFIELIGGAFGIHRVRKIDADFFIEHNTMVMLLRITGQPTERIEAPITEGVESPLRALILEAAETILKYSNDEVLQTYFGIVEQIGHKQIRLAKYRFEKYKNNPKEEIKVIAAWAWGLCMLKRYEEAEQKIREGIAKHKRAGRIYVIWGSLLTQTGKYKEALEKFDKALEQLDPHETKTRISNIYSSIGNCYLHLNKPDLALKFIERAIEVEKNSSRPYFNKAIVHLSINDHESFYESLERALEKGFQRENVLKDPNCFALKEDPRFKRLLEAVRD